jgi:hypothetical protein
MTAQRLGMTAQRLGMTAQRLGMTAQQLGMTAQHLGMTAQQLRTRILPQVVIPNPLSHRSATTPVPKPVYPIQH